MNYSAFLLDVVPHLAADPSEPVTLNAIKNACIEFCKKSWVWRVYADPMTVTARLATYDVESPVEADIAAVVTARLDGEVLLPRRQDQLDEELPLWQTATDRVRYFTQLDTETITLAPVPDATSRNGLALSLALQPLRSADELPRWIATQYWEGLAAGAVARLMQMPNKAWSDAKGGAEKRAVFEAFMAEAKEDAVRGLGRAVTRTKSQH